MYTVESLSVEVVLSLSHSQDTHVSCICSSITSKYLGGQKLMKSLWFTLVSIEVLKKIIHSFTFLNLPVYYDQLLGSEGHNDNSMLSDFKLMQKNFVLRFIGANDRTYNGNHIQLT